MVMGTLAGILACIGEPDQADQLLAKLPETAPVGRVMYHLLCSETDAVADWYEKDIELRQPNAVLWSAAEFFKPLRSGPRWRKLAKMMNLPA